MDDYVREPRRVSRAKQISFQMMAKCYCSIMLLLKVNELLSNFYRCCTLYLWLFSSILRAKCCDSRWACSRMMLIINTQTISITIFMPASTSVDCITDHQERSESRWEDWSQVVRPTQALSQSRATQQRHMFLGCRHCGRQSCDCMTWQWCWVHPRARLPSSTDRYTDHRHWPAPCRQCHSVP